jgi:thiol-disulfide isomerase/thioredoxin
MARTPSTMMPLGTAMPIFNLPDAHGNEASNQNEKQMGVLVMFLSNHCPFVVHLKPQLAAMAQKYTDRLSIFGIMSNDTDAYPADAPDKMREDCEAYQYCFPYLVDASQSVAKAFQAACTPDFFLFDAQGALFYRGQFDASRPGNEVPVTGDDMISAIEALLEGHPAPEVQQPSLGCNIKWRPGNEPDYCG